MIPHQVYTLLKSKEVHRLVMVGPEWPVVRAGCRGKTQCYYYKCCSVQPSAVGSLEEVVEDSFAEPSPTLVEPTHLIREGHQEEVRAAEAESYHEGCSFREDVVEVEVTA